MTLRSAPACSRVRGVFGLRIVLHGGAAIHCVLEALASDEEAQDEMSDRLVTGATPHRQRKASPRCGRRFCKRHGEPADFWKRGHGFHIALTCRSRVLPC